MDDVEGFSLAEVFSLGGAVPDATQGGGFLRFDFANGVRHLFHFRLAPDFCGV